MFALMTIKELYSEFISDLKLLHETGEAVAITNIIFEHFAGISTAGLIVNGKSELHNEVLKSMQDALTALKKNVPVQYITGKAWFYNLSFNVTDAVLIPRPETEELVLEAVNFLKRHTGRKVLDIGTGSGCIPISIKKNIPDALVTSIDVSKAALEVAEKNATYNKVKVDFLQIDFLEEKNFGLLSTFDLIISNPPYIPENEKAILNKNVTDHEPHLALFVPDNDPLLFYKKILIFAYDHLEKYGKILLEVHEDYAKETAVIFAEAHYEVEIKKDMQGKERMLVIYHSL